MSDEMGLGKTVQLLALCSLDKPYNHELQAAASARSEQCVDADADTCADATLMEMGDMETADESSGMCATTADDGVQGDSVLDAQDVSADVPITMHSCDVSRDSKGNIENFKNRTLKKSPEISSEDVSDVIDLTCEEIPRNEADSSETLPRKNARTESGTGRCWRKAPSPTSATDRNAMQPSSSNKATSSLHARLITREEPKLLNGGTLVICPMSILAQWEDELSLHLQPGHLRVAVHYGGDRTLSPRILARPDVVLTTYGVLSAEFVRNGQGGPGGPRSALYAVEWHRIILDEAHYIKGRHTQVAQAVFALQGERRWAVTGTPVQNKLDDLYPLLRFIQFEPWCQVTFWQRHVIRPFEEDKDLGALKVLRRALQPLLLRRTKDSKDREGRPILSLPPRVDEVVELDFAPEERELYDALFKYSRARFDALLAAGKVMNNYASILEMLLRLRQCCAHPYLMLSRCDPRMFDCPELARLASRLAGGAGPDPPINDAASGAPGADGSAGDAGGAAVVIAEESVAAQECPVCLESVDDGVATPCGHVFCRECINDAIRKSSGTLCPSCRAPVSRSELVSVRPPVGRHDFDAQAHWRSSKKLDYLVEQLTRLRAQDGDRAKAVVFSQWTGMLDLVETALRRAGLDFTRLDGSMPQQRRVESVEAFSASPRIGVLLISLKAGGVGINLTAASHVFLLDMWWNPAVDEQVPSLGRRQAGPPPSLGFITAAIRDPTSSRRAGPPP